MRFLCKKEHKRLVKKILNAIFRRALYVASFPAALLIVLTWPFYRIRFIGLQAFRIGHYALNTELMLCAFDISCPAHRQKTLFYNMSVPCNQQLHSMWKRVIPIVPFSTIATQINLILSLILAKSYCDDAIKKTYEQCAGAVDTHGFLKKISQPHLSFTKKETEIAKKILEQLGMPNQVPFICLIVRDSAYLNIQYPDNDWRYHDHRNADIQSYKKVALYFAKKGYYVFRIGKFVNDVFQCEHPNIIDYANHPLRSDFMDVYLPAHCVFTISTCTGLDCVSQIFRKPVLMTNISPVFNETLMWYPCTLFIPKLLKNRRSKQLLSFSETAKICSGLSSKNILAEFEARDLTLIDNTEDQLLAVAIEMEARVTGKWCETQEQQMLQAQYWEHAKKYRPIFVNDIYIQIGADFLQKNTLMLH